MIINNRLIDTVSPTSNKTSSFRYKKTIISLSVIIFLFLIASFWFIETLSNKVDVLKEKERKLLSQTKLYSLEIKDRMRDINEISSKLDNIEEIIGVRQSDDINELQRVNIAQITLKERNYMLEIIPNGSPLKNTIITSKFGYRIHPITKKKKFHRGLDFRAKRKTPIYATADGIVRYVQPRNKGSFGRVVIISHNYGFETLFAHLRKTKVKVGDIVYKGNLIAFSGNSGRSSGPHLHYEIRYGIKSLNPYYFVKWNIKTYDNIFKKVPRVKWKPLLTLIKKHKLTVNK